MDHVGLEPMWRKFDTKLEKPSINRQLLDDDMMKKPQFILPPRENVLDAAQSDKSYAILNYYGRGFIARAKRQRFQRALSMGSEVSATRAIDMGCADGLLLPSLSRMYEHVAAIDINPEFVERSERLVNNTALPNVQICCSAQMNTSQLKDAIGDGYKVMYLLETLEHVGRQPNVWESKMEFLRECFELLDLEGQIIITVPKMVGPIMVFKNLLQRALGKGYDRMTFRQLLRSGFLYDTDELEPLWDGHHVGFNHLKLDQHLQEHFQIHNRRESAISVFYRIASQ